MSEDEDTSNNEVKINGMWAGVLVIVVMTFFLFVTPKCLARANTSQGPYNWSQDRETTIRTCIRLSPADSCKWLQEHPRYFH